MPTEATKTKAHESGAHMKSSAPVILKDLDQFAKYLAAHLKPVAHGPNGQPIYDDDEVKALNVRLAKPS